MPHTRTHTRPKRRRMRRYPDIFGNEHRENLLWDLLNVEEPDIEELIGRLAAGEPLPPTTRVYLYRLINGQTVKPALWSGPPFPSLIEFMQKQFGGGSFLCLVRCGKQMRLSGILRIAARPGPQASA